MVRHSCHALLSALVASLAVAIPSARGESIYLVSQSGGSLLRFDSSDAVDLADPGATTSVTTLVTGLQQPSGLALGPDGKLYIAEWGPGGSTPARVSRYDIGTGQWAPLVSLLPGQIQPSAIAFRPTNLGGQMLVGRVGRFNALGEGDIVQISDWNTGSPAVSATPFNSGIILDGSSGLAVAADGTTYVSNSRYMADGMFAGDVVRLGSTGAFGGQVVADGGISGLYGPAGLVLDGSTLYTGSVSNSKVFRTTDLAAFPPTTIEFGSVGPGELFEVGPITQLADGSILGGSVTGSAVVSIFAQPDGTLSTSGYFNPAFGTIGGMVVAPVPEPSSVALAAAAAVAAWAGRRGFQRRRA